MQWLDRRGLGSTCRVSNRRELELGGSDRCIEVDNIWQKFSRYWYWGEQEGIWRVNTTSGTISGVELAGDVPAVNVCAGDSKGVVNALKGHICWFVAAPAFPASFNNPPVVP